MMFLHKRLSAFRLVLLATMLLVAGAAALFFFKKHADTKVVYGAVAVGLIKGAWGVSDPASDKQAANKSALDYCVKYGDDCKIVLNLKNDCVAIAQGNKGEITWAENDTPEKARSEAQSACILKAKDACEIKRWTCY